MTKLSLIKKIGTGLAVGVVLYFLIYVYARDFFNSFLLSYENTKVDKWDVGQYVFGYWVDEATLNAGFIEPYLSKSDFTQFLFPCLLQILGIAFSIHFLRIPLSYQQFIISRVITKRRFFLIYLKSIASHALYYSFLLIIVTFFATANSLYLSLEGSFKYQSGNFFLALLLFTVSIAIMIVALSSWIFVGYCKGKQVQYLVVTFSSLVFINIFDKFTLSVNLVLFDKTNFFMDGILFWCLILVLAVFSLNTEEILQEEC